MGNYVRTGVFTYHLYFADETTGTIFGRNQLLVIKMLMQNFEGTAYPMKLTSEERLVSVVFSNII